MQYTVLGRTGCKVSRLGFGTVFLPMLTSTEVDRDLAIPMLHRAVELGVNLFDTAEGYCGQDSQRVLGEAFEVAASVSKGGPEAVRVTKEFLRKLSTQSFDENLKSSLALHKRVRKSREALEGIRAFVEKREPNWIK